MRATELEWLQWFYANADFGPGHGDVMHWLKQRFQEKSGKLLPEGYDEDE